MRLLRSLSLPRHDNTIRLCIVFLILFNLFFLRAAFALDPQKTINQYVHAVWETENGLPQNAVHAVAQTPDGFLWLATEEGLTRFDGNSFTVFNKQNTPAIQSNIILALYTDRKGTLWIGTHGGGLMEYKNEAFTAYTTADGLSNNIVWSILEDHEGTLWVGTAGGGINRFKNNKFTAYTTKQGLSNDTVRSIFEDRDNRLWIGTEGGLNLLQNDKFIHYTTRNGLSNDSVICMNQDPEGRLWIGTQGGLNLFKNDKFTHYTTKNGLSNDSVWALYPDRQGNFWIGTYGGGLDRYTRGKFSSYSIKDGLSDDVVLALFEDRQRNLWVGTGGGGFNEFRDGKFTTYTTQEGLSNNMALPIFEDSKNNLWIGTLGGGLNLFKNGKFTHYSAKNGLTDNIVISLAEDHNGNLWIGTYGGGLFKFAQGKFTQYTAKDGLSNNAVRAIQEDQDGNLWIGTTGGGLNEFKNGKFTVTMPRQGLAGTVVRFIYPEPNGTLWIGTDGGLNRLAHGKLEKYTTKDGLSGNSIACIYQDDLENLWIGTIGTGLNRFKNGKFSSISAKQGLYDDTIYQILEEPKGSFWINSAKGIFQVKRENLEKLADGKISAVTTTAYGKEDGLKAVEGNGGTQPTGWKTHDGRLWFPTSRGVAVIDPNHLEQDKTPPPIYIMKVLANGQAVRLTKPMILAKGVRRLEFHYAAPDFVAPDKMQFRYKLSGFDSDWVNAGSRRVAYYTNIPPGDYSFQVIASNSDGVWNENGASLKFYLKPYFYQTRSFDIIILLAVIFVAFQFSNLRAKVLKKRAQELEKIVEERTHQLEDSKQKLEKANLQLERLAATDGLTGIANRRHCMNFLEREWRRAMRNQQPLSLLLADVDYFKDYNDTYGHLKGDDCLKQVARTISSLINRPGDLVARYGGEEFLVVLTETPAQGALKLAEDVRQSIEAVQIPHRSSKVTDHVTISIGAASIIPSPQSSLTEFLEKTDQALYQAKQAGRNQVSAPSLS